MENTKKEVLATPSVTDVQRIGNALGFALSDEGAAEYLPLVSHTLAPYSLVASLPDFLPKVKYARGEWKVPTKEDNPYNAWSVRTNITGASSGPLLGRTIAIKDNVCIADIPMQNGSRTLDGCVPEIDATVIERLLDAGATIIGKTNCEDLCFSAGSHTTHSGPVINPHKAGHSAGGSSSGSAVVVATGEADMAIACDQGGSIRLPASLCGCYGMKPTWGLVPYTGIVSIEHTYDHVGPITRNVHDNALMLEVLAGDDGMDSRCKIPHDVDKHYTQAKAKGVKGLKIGILKEGFEADNADPQVNRLVKEAAEVLRSLGAEVSEVSIPQHKLGLTIWTPIGLESGFDTLMTNGFGKCNKGLYPTSVGATYSRGIQAHAADLAPTVQVNAIAAQYVRESNKAEYYCKARNLARWLTQLYDTAFESYDLLLLPTIPIVAQPLPSKKAEDVLKSAFETVANTPSFNITGHPAMSIPCGLVEGLPVGMMLVARHFCESTIYAAAFAYEARTTQKN